MPGRATRLPTSITTALSVFTTIKDIGLKMISSQIHLMDIGLFKHTAIFNSCRLKYAVAHNSCCQVLLPGDLPTISNVDAASKLFSTYYSIGLRPYEYEKTTTCRLGCGDFQCSVCDYHRRVRGRNLSLVEFEGLTMCTGYISEACSAAYLILYHTNFLYTLEQ